MIQNRNSSKRQQTKKQDRVTYKIDNHGNFSEVKESNKSMFDANKIGGFKNDKTTRAKSGYKPKYKSRP